VRREAVQDIAAQTAWVVDCWYMAWTDDLLRQADLIIWLDLPWRVTGWRLLRRHVLADLAGNNAHPGLRKLFRFLWSERRGCLDPPSSQADLLRRDANNRPATARVLAGHGAKVAHCRRSADVAAVRRLLTAPPPVSGRRLPGRPWCG
jgi:adenylate kinase family enzyme